MTSNYRAFFHFIYMSGVVATAGLLLAIGCGSEEGQDPDVGFDADIGPFDVEPESENACGGDGALVYEDQAVEPGDACGPCQDGVIACDGIHHVRCAAATAANECGGCAPLPGRAGDPCGPCDSGVWACDGDGGMTCIGALEHNLCGGCGVLETQPTMACEGTDGDPGVVGCTGPDAVRCVSAGENACGGIFNLDAEPGTNCGECNGGVWACESEETVVCENADWGVNVCGGCEPIFGVIGDECGKCEGEWTCDGTEDVVCDVDPLNACGGCGDLGEAMPGQQCAPDAIYICDAPDSLICPVANGTAMQNACGGTNELEAPPGQQCGDCGDGMYLCMTAEKVACVATSSKNSCGGCNPLPTQPGDTCGPCGLDTVVCDGAEAAVCDGSTPCPELQFETHSVDDVTQTSATFRGALAEFSMEPILDHGFCWGRAPMPTPIEGQCQSLGAIDEIGDFEYRTNDLLPGRNYYVRAFVASGIDREYAGELSFVTDVSSPNEVQASLGEYVDHVALSWEPDDTVQAYIIYRDGVEIDTVDGDQDAFEDTGATAAGVPLAPDNVAASDSLSTDYILITWDEAQAPTAPDHAYEVVAVYPDQTSEKSEAVTGRRKHFEITDYALSIDEGDWFEVGLVDTYEDDQAPMATITAGTATATGGDFDTHVALEYMGPTEVESHSAGYRVRAISDAGEGEESADIEGVRQVDDVFYFQWFYSDEVSPTTFEPLFAPASADGDQFNDDTAPENGAIRSYYLTISAAGAVTTNTNVVTGFRSFSGDLTTEAVTHIETDQATFHAAITELGAPNPDAHGFCYGTMTDPIHGSGATCTDLGELVSTGPFQQTVLGLDSGTTYYVRAYIANTNGTIYGEVAGFTTLTNAPTNLIATSDSEYVALSWTGVSGANGYRVYRNEVELTVEPIGSTSFNDTDAAAGDTPEVPPNFSATNGEHTDRVVLSWDVPDVADGPSYDYYVVAINESGGSSAPSNTAPGNRSAHPIDEYELEIDGGEWTGLGDVTTVDDEEAAAPTIAGGDASASQGDFDTHVALQITGVETLIGDESSYRIRAKNSVGTSDASSAQTGYRGAGIVTYQWQRSAGDSPENYSDLQGANAVFYEDTDAPVDGSTRYYQVVASAAGAVDHLVDAGAGYRAPDLSDAWNWNTVATGHGTSCGIRDDQTLWCWGSNGVGRLGLDDTDSRDVPHQVGTESDWIAITVGAFHTCGVRNDGTLWCWGYNNYGQSGQDPGETTAIHTPEQVGTHSGWVDVDASAEYHTCGIRENGTLWCWGRNNNSQLGQGLTDLDDRHQPVQVENNADWLAVSGGAGSTCGIREDIGGQGTLWCWGSGTTLGLGGTTFAGTPQQVGSESDWTGIDTRGGAVACAIRDPGSIWCWGNNWDGNLGQGDTTPRDTPTQVETDTDWNAVVAGSCGIKTNGERWCWGPNGDGELGMGESPEQLSPVHADDGDDWAELSTKESFMCGIREDRTLWCWGNNDAGQLGQGDEENRNVPTVVVDGVANEQGAGALGDACTGQDDCGDGTWCPEDTTEAFCSPQIDFAGGDVTMEFQYALGGTFDMGPNEGEVGALGNEEQVEVTLTRDFFIQRTEVTQGQWKELSGTSNPAENTACGDHCPVEQITWWSALWYANELSSAAGLEPCYDLDVLSCSGNGADGTLACGDQMPPIADSNGDNPYECTGYRLPTEAEWERAARATTTTATYNGDNSSTGCYDGAVDPIAWYCGNSDNESHEVAQLLPNDWGLFDMLGNVEHWTWDRQEPSTPPGGTDPRVEESGHLRVLKGGNFINSANGVRSAFRNPERLPPDVWQNIVGFRLVRTAE